MKMTSNKKKSSKRLNCFMLFWNTYFFFKSTLGKSLKRYLFTGGENRRNIKNSVYLEFPVPMERFIWKSRISYNTTTYLAQPFRPSCPSYSKIGLEECLAALSFLYYYIYIILLSLSVSLCIYTLFRLISTSDAFLISKL